MSGDLAGRCARLSHGVVDGEHPRVSPPTLGNLPSGRGGVRLSDRRPGHPSRRRAVHVDRVADTWDAHRPLQQALACSVQGTVGLGAPVARDGRPHPRPIAVGGGRPDRPRRPAGRAVGPWRGHRPVPPVAAESPGSRALRDQLSPRGHLAAIPPAEPNTVGSISREGGAAGGRQRPRPCRGHRSPAASCPARRPGRRRHRIRRSAAPCSARQHRDIAVR